jgi:hypothetical protein
MTPTLRPAKESPPERTAGRDAEFEERVVPRFDVAAN